MKKGILALVLVLAVLGFSGLALAQGYGRSMSAYHDQMEEILESGDYDDLVALREQTGTRMMPWVDSQEKFEFAKEQHESMEQSREKYGIENSQGKGRRMGGCMGW